MENPLASIAKLLSQLCETCSSSSSINIDFGYLLYQALTKTSALPLVLTSFPLNTSLCFSLHRLQQLTFFSRWWTAILPYNHYSTRPRFMWSLFEPEIKPFTQANCGIILILQALENIKFLKLFSTSCTEHTFNPSLASILAFPSAML